MPISAVTFVCPHIPDQFSQVFAVVDFENPGIILLMRFALFIFQDDSQNFTFPVHNHDKTSAAGKRHPWPPPSLTFDSYIYSFLCKEASPTMESRAFCTSSETMSTKFNGFLTLWFQLSPLRALSSKLFLHRYTLANYSFNRALLKCSIELCIVHIRHFNL
ncbi:hypothetical protein KP509_28G004100 [Ceratopteris richardii]|uniref:Uncharacterized protein n=1 Tax=Ceratopteris richardii TaxID=49495 RepID=A0A8T2R943_CERRI|nr:hypothetical protein KP509_28G004100 [Ceratopteris richardii]